MKDRTETCGTCRYYDKYRHWCRRHAPSMIHWEDKERSSGSITIIDNFGKWPVVEDEEDWCGEHEEVKP